MTRARAEERPRMDLVGWSEEYIPRPSRQLARGVPIMKLSRCDQYELSIRNRARSPCLPGKDINVVRACPTAPKALI